MIVALVLLSALLHALWNAMLRLERAKDRALVIATAVGTLFAVAVAGTRWAMGSSLFPSSTGVAFSAAAGAFEGLYFAALARAMERGRLGTVYTVSRGGAVLVVWPLSIALYGEVANAPALIGSAVVLVGLAASGFGAPGAAVNQPAGSNTRAALGWSLICAASIAGYHLMYKAALRDAVNPSACFALSLAIAALINFARLDATGRAALGPLIRTRGWRLLAMGALCAGSFLILIEALARGGSGLVLTLRNTSVLFAAGLAWLIRERPTRLELAGAALVALGAALMAWT